MNGPTTERSERPYAGSVVDLRVDTVRYADGHRAVREVVEHPGGAVVVPVTDDGRVLLIRQYRHPVGSFITELPAGKLEPDEEPEECARRELAEETGFGAASLRLLTSIYTTPGFCDEVLHIFLADGLTPLPGGQALDQGETQLTVHPMPMDEALRMIDDGTIRDGKTIAGLLMADRQRRRTT